MMRILFLFFLLLNAVYFYLQFSDTDEPASSAILKQPPLPQGVEKLTLLRERGLGGKNSLPPKKSTQTTGKTEVGKPAEKQAKKTTKIAAKPKQQKPKERPQKSREPACFTLGPFDKVDVVSRVAEEISALGTEVKRRQVSRRTPKGYWVYLPPSKSYKAAKRKVAELQKKGLKDLFIMGKGSRMNAISLGLFKSENAADERFQQVKRLGLKAILETQYRVSNQAWLDMTVPGGKTATVAAMTEMADGLPQAELSQRKCQ